MGKSDSGRWRLDGVTGGQSSTSHLGFIRGPSPPERRPRGHGRNSGGGTLSLRSQQRLSVAQVRFYTVDSRFKKRSQSPQSSRKWEKSLERLDGPMSLCLMEFELDSAV